MKWSRQFCVLLSLTLVGLSSPDAFGQTVAAETGLSPRQLMIRLTSGAGTGSGVTNIGEVIADLVGLEVSTAPLGSSAGGFTFTFDPATRAFTRAAPSFGPMFGERAVTAGEGRANFGINFIHTTYDTLDGLALDAGELQSMRLQAGSTVLWQGAAELKINTNTTVIFANAALNEWFDLGVAVPFVSLRMEGTHQVRNETRNIVEEETSGSASASGIGDVALRGKVRVYRKDQGGFAIGVDARVPTGDKESLLGAGVTRTGVSGIWSGTFGRLAPHASAGFEYWSDPFQVYDPLEGAAVDAGRHAILYTGGVEWAASDRLTVNGELTGRNVRGGGRLEYRDVPFRSNPFGITSASVATVGRAGLRQVSAAAGIKWNFAGAALLTASVLMPLDDAGLRDNFTPLVGLDWGF
jgi:hypothetical protein